MRPQLRPVVQADHQARLSGGCLRDFGDLTDVEVEGADPLENVVLHRDRVSGLEPVARPDQKEGMTRPVLNDLREGKLTMPLLLSLPRATAAERERVARVMSEREFDSVAPSEILEIAETHGGLAETRSLARDYAGAARVALGSFPESEAKDGLLLATESVIDRVG